METYEGLFLTIFWFVVRFGLPVLITVAVVLFLKKLDTRWREQAEEVRAQAVTDGVIPVVKCWLLNDCPEAAKKDCMAYQNQGKPQSRTSLNHSQCPPTLATQAARASVSGGKFQPQALPLLLCSHPISRMNKPSSVSVTYLFR